MNYSKEKFLVVSVFSCYFVNVKMYTNTNPKRRFDIMKNKIYNINNYIRERRKECIVDLSSVMLSIKGNKPVILLPAAHKSLRTIQDEPFYVGTNFKQIGLNKDARFAIVSAPGATGKSAFGKHLAYTKNGLYWNLAEITLGDGTFQGTLYRALGAQKVSTYAKQLHDGEVTLVIDAFDEAEIISGRKNVETFISEANDFLEDATVPSVVMLSRTETAQNIAAFLKSKKIPFVHYEIDFFPETPAKSFVEAVIKRKRAITPAIKECIDQYFFQIQRLIKDANVLKGFLGYAPVLEAMAAHISEISNTAKLISELSENANEITLIGRIMDNLLDREQEKFISAFQERLKEDAERISDWSKIYNREEQLIRVLNYILLNEITFDDYVLDDFPKYYSDEYIETISRFLPQHPFIQNTISEEDTASEIDFAGPAFRDYSLAHIILNKDQEASAELYYQREYSTAHFPSQLFWNHYIELSDNHVKSNHLSYLFEAYKAKTWIGCQTFLAVSQNEIGTLARFLIAKGNETVEITDLDVDVVDDSFYFDAVSNTSINVDGTVYIGQTEISSISDSSIICNEIIFRSKKISINAFTPNTTIIVCKLPVKSQFNPTIVQTNSDGAIQIDIPNVYDYPKLSRYKKTFESEDANDIYSFIYNLRKIFECFRTHKKDMPARDAEKIDFVIIGDNKLRKDVFTFLIEKEIVFRSSHLYKVNLDEMSKMGISWGALMATNTSQLQHAYQCFREWNALTE